MTREYRLALVTDSRVTGGAEQFLSYLALGLPPEVDVWCMGVGSEVLERIQETRPGMRSRLFRPGVRGAATALREVDPDVVLINLSSFTANRWAWIAALLQRRRTVVVDHAPTRGLSWRGRALQRVMTAGVGARIAVGPGTARQVEEWGGLRPGTVASILNGIPPCDQFIQSRGRARTIGMLARLDPGKGIDLCLSAIAGIPDIRLLVGGEGPGRADLEALARRLGVAERVEFLGFVRPEEVLGQVDIVVMPSRSEGGCLPFSLLEAMHRGVPTVVSAFGCVPDVLVDRVNTMIVPIEDGPALRAAISTLIGDESLRRSIVAQALDTARERFTAASMAGRYNDVFSTLLP